MRGIADVHGLERQRHFQELLKLGNAAFIIFAAAGAGEDDVIVAKAFGVPVAMQSVGHRTATSSFADFSTNW